MCTFYLCCCHTFLSFLHFFIDFALTHEIPNVLQKITFKWREDYIQVPLYHVSPLQIVSSCFPDVISVECACQQGGPSGTGRWCTVTGTPRWGGGGSMWKSQPGVRRQYSFWQRRSTRNVLRDGEVQIPWNTDRPVRRRLDSSPAQHQEIMAGARADRQVNLEGVFRYSSIGKVLPGGSSGGTLVWSGDMGAYRDNDAAIIRIACDFPVAGHT